MQVNHLDGFDARCSAKGVERDVSLFLLQGEDIEVGDYLLIHVGYAIQKLSAQQARETWELFDQLLEEDTDQHA
jgi:hydrogenase expression/formation protein HypC